MPPELVIFMHWIGLLELKPQPAPAPQAGGVWFKDGEVPF